jgi:phospholipid/cholesterol/gamma-HCH transport system substrate-binding protein
VRRRTEVTVGIVVLAGLALIFFGTLWLKGVGFGREEVTVRARFREVGQLQVGNAVKFRGVPIGRVEAIELEPGGEGVIVSLRINAHVALPPDPVVLLSPESLFGDWQAEVYPRSRFPRYDYAEPRDPAVLPGYSLPEFSRLTAAADQIAENLAVLSERFEAAFTEETAENVRLALENIQEVSEQVTRMIGAQETTLADLSENLQATTETLGQAAEAVRRVSAQIEAAISGGELEAIVDNVARTTAQLDSFSAALLAASRNLESVLVQADSALRGLSLVAGAAGSGTGTLGRLVQDTTLYADLVRTNALIQQLIEDFRANPRKYINLKIF